ncbi:hypothetical protein CEXT_51081 [Caerostris extrusa]|uniref:Uncharacterized protein n=1 Tax=Caerostris extrusa TaxID=172846 RepID=A0AAV4MZE7_CAEEX|nr:hypothetical protein CEXT_51081 [Caerostris extrusa]
MPQFLAQLLQWDKVELSKFLSKQKKKKRWPQLVNRRSLSPFSEMSPRAAEECFLADALAKEIVRRREDPHRIEAMGERYGAD